MGVDQRNAITTARGNEKGRRRQLTAAPRTGAVREADEAAVIWPVSSDQLRDVRTCACVCIGERGGERWERVTHCTVP